jgi:hypothetical protein
VKSPFIKSRDTSASVVNSRGEVEKMLRRYGAFGTSIQATFDEKQRPEGITVSFVVRDRLGSEHKVPVSLPINVKHVYDALYERPTRSIQADGKWRTVHNPNGYDTKKLEQAERVAWRNLVLWIDAALSAAAIGLQTITEAFYAHTVIQLEGGGQARLADYIERVQGQLAPGIRALLSSPAEDA